MLKPACLTKNHFPVNFLFQCVLVVCYVNTFYNKFVSTKMTRKPIFVITLLALLTSGIAEDASISPHIVQTRNGPLQGVEKVSRNGSPYVSFTGVRYAQPQKRFEPPEPLQETWTTPKVANKQRSCAQYGGFTESVLDEDCLFLNIHVPKKHLESKDNALSKLPVMLWIHGGGFTFGAGHEYGAEYFMDDGDIILITINYRLGIFGFLSLEDDTVTGNNGLRDQVMALRWTQENIASFNGDPSQVTVVGNSAGSASIHYLLMSPLSSGLFQNAILQSGSFSFWSLTRNPKGTAVKLAEYLNCTISNESEDDDDDEVSTILVRKCLENKSVMELLTAQTTFWPRWPEPNLISRFIPTAKESSKDPFFPAHPGSLYGRHIKYANHPNVMMGVTQSEGSTIMASFVLSSEQSLQEINDKWDEVVPLTLCIDTIFPTDAFPFVSQKIKDFYFGKDNKAVSVETAQQLSDMYSDALFVVPVMVSADEMARDGITVYPYVYSYDSDWNVRKAMNLVDPPENVGHGDELQYLFTHGMLSRPLEPNSEADEYSKTLVRFWKEFAKHGKPASEWKPGKKVSWSHIQPHPQQPTNYLMFERLSIGKEPTILPKVDFTNRVRFWMKLLHDFAYIPPAIRTPPKNVADVDVEEDDKTQKTEL